MRTLLQKLKNKIKDKYIMPTSLKKEIVNKKITNIKTLICMDKFKEKIKKLPFSQHFLRRKRQPFVYILNGLNF